LFLQEQIKDIIIFSQWRGVTGWKEVKDTENSERLAHRFRNFLWLDHADNLRKGPKNQI
jgi:uncharacterized protein CbrC (UPF0167 family)